MYFAAQYPARTYPCRRFAPVLADDGARLGAGTVRHASTIHLLLTDVVMPRMSGRQLADQLCAQRSDTRVLFMSGYGGDAVISRGIVDSGITLLHKPFTRDSLLRTARNVIDA